VASYIAKLMRDKKGRVLDDPALVSSLEWLVQLFLNLRQPARPRRPEPRSQTVGGKGTTCELTVTPEEK
jgi:hypothetical protein